MKTIDPADMAPAWSNKNCEEAQREGWDIFSTCGSDGGPWQIQRFDDASEVPGAPQLKSDDAAWAIVLKGSKPHHEAARLFIRAHNPREWAAFNPMDVPTIGQRVSVRGIDGAILVGDVTGHDTKDGKAIFEYEYDQLPDGSLVKLKKWGWPEQLLPSSQLTWLSLPQVEESYWP